MNHHRLKCYLRLMEVAKTVPTLARMLPRGEGNLMDQFKRALTSSILNLSEGSGRTSAKERNRFFDISLASLAEVSSVIDIFVVYNYIPKTYGIESKNHLRRIYQLLSKLKK